MPVDPDLLEAAEQELRNKAATDPNRAAGYYPKVPGTDNEVLDYNKVLAGITPQISHGGQDYSFNWTRLLLEGGPRQAKPSYHLDADMESGLQGTDLRPDFVPRAEVWRLLFNFHISAERRLAYLSVSVNGLAWRLDRGNIGLVEEANQLVPAARQELVIPPRSDQHAYAAVICVSRVAHAGLNDGQGYFLASWGREEAA